MSKALEPTTTGRTWRKLSSFTGEEKTKPSAPLAMNNQTLRHPKKRRSSSLTEFIGRILPSRRREKGHTLREQYKDDGTQDPVALVFGLATNRKSHDRCSACSDASKTRITKSAPITKVTPVTATRDSVTSGGLKRTGTLKRTIGSLQTTIMTSDDVKPSGMTQPTTPSFYLQPELAKNHQLDEEAKRIRREQRKSHRESDDYLGVQGANPRTGRVDTSNSTSVSGSTHETLNAFQYRAKSIAEQQEKLRQAQKSLLRMQIAREQKKIAQVELQEEQFKQRSIRRKWKSTHTGWNVVQYSDLSPIPQSLPGTPITEATPIKSKLLGQESLKESASLLQNPSHDFNLASTSVATPTKIKLFGHNSHNKSASPLHVKPAHVLQPASASATPSKTKLFGQEPVKNSAPLLNVDPAQFLDFSGFQAAAASLPEHKTDFFLSPNITIRRKPVSVGLDHQRDDGSSATVVRKKPALPVRLGPFLGPRLCTTTTTTTTIIAPHGHPVPARVQRLCHVHPAETGKVVAAAVVKGIPCHQPGTAGIGAPSTLEGSEPALRRVLGGEEQLVTAGDGELVVAPASWQDAAVSGAVALAGFSMAIVAVSTATMVTALQVARLMSGIHL